MPFLQRGDSTIVAVPASQSIAIGAPQNAIANVLIPAGLTGGPSSTVTNTTSQVFGPFPAGASVTVVAASGTVEYVVGASPSAGGGGGSGSGVAQSLGNVSGAVAINLANGSNVALTVTGNITFSFTGTPSTGTAQRVILTITNGGAGTNTWPAGTRWAGAGIVGSAPSLAASGTEKIAIDITNFAGSLAYDASYIGRVA